MLPNGKYVFLADNGLTELFIFKWLIVYRIGSIIPILSEITITFKLLLHSKEKYNVFYKLLINNKKNPNKRLYFS